MRRDKADRILAERLRRERLLAGKSREELGRALGISAQLVRAYECSTIPLPANFIAAAVEALGVPLRMLCYEQGDGGLSKLDDNGREPRLRIAILRPPSILTEPRFAQVLPIIKVWQATHGELTEDVYSAVTACGLWQRTVLVRRPFQSGRLITRHFGPGIKILRPCEALLITGQDFDDHHTDRAYGMWVSRAYAEALRSRSLRVECIRALVRDSASVTLRTRYDRVLVPWQTRDGDQYAMALSIQREPPVAASQAGLNTL